VGEDGTEGPDDSSDDALDDSPNELSQ